MFYQILPCSHALNIDCDTMSDEATGHKTPLDGTTFEMKHRIHLTAYIA